MAGQYRLEFDLISDPLVTRPDGLFRQIALDLQVDDITRSYHVPLLLAPYSLTTYRGS